jgi:2-C-methyl-D-erythritol 2,4-cyclodiphosphate synthase
MKMNRVGFGFDVHKFKVGIPFILGGVDIPYHKGLLGHSDADVLIHAVCDALLGAAALRDIGYHFPDTSKEFKGIRSTILLERVVELLKENDYAIGNVDCTIALQEPKISQFITYMQENMASIMNLTQGSVSVKATTTEQLGFTGRGEGVAVWAVAMIYSTKD